MYGKTGRLSGTIKQGDGGASETRVDTMPLREMGPQLKLNVTKGSMPLQYFQELLAISSIRSFVNFNLFSHPMKISTEFLLINRISTIFYFFYFLFPSTAIHATQILELSENLTIPPL